MDRDAKAEERQEDLELEDAHALGALYERNRSLRDAARDAQQLRLVAVQEEQRAAREEGDATSARLDADAIERAGEARYQMRMADANALRDLDNTTAQGRPKKANAELLMKAAREEQRRTDTDAAALRLAAEQEGKDANKEEQEVLSEMSDVRALKALLAQNHTRRLGSSQNVARDAEQIQSVAVKEVQRAAKEETEALYTQRDAAAVARAGEARARMAALGAGALKRLAR
jgi:hypothetical protein